MPDFATHAGEKQTFNPDTDTAPTQARSGEAPLPGLRARRNGAVAALRFFFNQTVDRPDLARKLIGLRYPRKMPVMLSPDEPGRLIAATTCLKHHAALNVTYGAGLRVAEVASLRVSDIDGGRMLIEVVRGKGGHSRHALLSPNLLVLLRGLWKEGRQQGVM